MELVASWPPCLIGMETCSGAHYWAREFEKLGHTVRLMAPRFVAPYRMAGKRGKNDANDAQAICEAVARPTMRFVPIKNIEQQTAVDKVRKGKGRVVNERFATMCAHYLVDPDFCNVASDWEKGVVEKNVQDSRRRIWIEAAKHKFFSFAELNAWLAELLEHERAHLMPMPAPFDGYVEKPARVSSTCATRCGASCTGRWSARGCTPPAWPSWRATASSRATTG